MSRADEIRNNLSNEYEKTPGYLVWDIAEAVGQELDEQDLEILKTRLMLDADNLTGNELTRFVKQRKGIVRKEAASAIGEVTVYGNGIVSVGDIFETENGVQFRATEEITVTDNALIAIEAIIPGNNGIVGAHSITQMPVTIEGISACDNTEPTHDGYDEESDTELRERYYTALRTPSNGANKAQYKQWALEVSGVGDAKVFPLGHGNNTVDIVIINALKNIASQELVAEVQSYIDPSSQGKGEGKAMIGARCYVESATALNISVTAKLTIEGVQSEVEAKVRAAISKYLASIAFTDSTVSYAQISNAIIDVSEVLDLENLKVNNGTVNIAVPERKVAILSGVTFTYA